MLPSTMPTTASNLAQKAVETVAQAPKVLTGRNDEGGSTRCKKLLPILIFPGFMSSALEIKRSSDSTRTSWKDSSLKQSWEGKRVWLNLQSAGFSSLYFGGALKMNADRAEVGEEYDESLQQQYEVERECKNAWLRHLKLAEDMKSEHPGVKVRPLTGLKAVDYLVRGSLPGAVLAKHLSWVFSPVLKVLLDLGYEEGFNLDAAPYDWRLPPGVLEERDSYFSRTIQLVEAMYKRNNNTPIVLLCHSMGGKTCHYFLNFCLHHRGREWLDNHIHTYMPVAAPHLGSIKAIRGIIIGDRMGLETFLSKEEGVLCARSFGSVPWMFPRTLPEKNAPPIAVLRRQGALHVTVLPFSVKGVLQDRPAQQSMSAQLRVDVEFRNQKLHTTFRRPEGQDSQMNFEETFIFATPPEPPNGDNGKLRISLYEKGLPMKNRGGTDQTRCFSWITSLFGWSARCFCCPSRQFYVCCPCRTVQRTVVTAADTATSVLGSVSLLAESNELDLSGHDLVDLAVDPSGTELSMQLLHAGEWIAKRKNMVGFRTTADRRASDIKVLVRWEPPGAEIDTDELSDIRVAVASATPPPLDVHHVRDRSVAYESVDGVQLFRSEYMPRLRDVLADCYEADPIGPRTLSSEGAPPVKRVKAVYGINVPTEVSAVYRKRNLVKEKGRVNSLHELDAAARLDDSSGDYVIDKGLIMETDRTPQIVLGETTNDGEPEIVHCSGDGSVPYWSLQYSRTWQGQCEVMVDEIPGAEHRAILADESFHKILTEYVSGDGS